MSAAHAAEIIDAVENARSSGENIQLEVHGWSIAWVLRPKGAATRGDLCARPGDGSPPLYSVVSIKRKLGLIAAAPVVERGASSSEDSAAVERSKRDRKALNVYAKAYGLESIGLRVSIKWDGDAKWYKGVVHSYDPISLEHTITCKSMRPANILLACFGTEVLVWLLILHMLRALQLHADEDGDKQQHNLGIEESIKQLKWLQEPVAAKKKQVGDKRKKSEGGDGSENLKPAPKNFRPPLPPPKARIKISSGQGPPGY